MEQTKFSSSNHSKNVCKRTWVNVDVDAFVYTHTLPTLNMIPIFALIKATTSWTTISQVIVVQFAFRYAGPKYCEVQFDGYQIVDFALDLN